MKIPLLILLIGLTGAGIVAAQRKVDTALTPAEAAQLQRDKLVLTQRHFRQVFTPYVDSPMPVFITSDSLLNGWHVLLEESLVVLENQHALTLSGALAASLEEIARQDDPPFGKDPATWNKGRQRALIVLGTASRLMGGTWRGSPEVEVSIAEQVNRVEAAAGIHLPAWLPPARDMAGLDCTVFRPTGFYERSPRLRCYFRALRWLQTIPFRSTDEVEMMAMDGVVSAFGTHAGISELVEDYRHFGGKAAEMDAVAVTEMSTNGLDDWQKKHQRETAKMVILSSSLLPDAEVFAKSTGPARLFPDGEEIGAWLGSTLARGRLRAAAVPLPAEREFMPRRWDVRMYDAYLDSLSVLFAPPELEAPAFMKSEAWQRKMLNTGLAGWAQLRHAWLLQSKENVLWLSSSDPFPGFVEPVPEFYRRMGEVITKGMERFDTAGVLTISPDGVAQDAADLLPDLQPLVAGMNGKIKDFAAKLTPGVPLSEEQRAEYENIKIFPDELLERLNPFVDYVDSVAHGFPRSPLGNSDIHDPIRLLEEIQEIAAGKQAGRIREEVRSNGRTSLGARWAELRELCHQLESMAHKQLRGVEPVEDEKGFIRGYGASLGRVMLYDGNSYKDPRDDAPRIATVFTRTGADSLLAGVGRPQEIRVLYPWKGQEIECRGAVMPYYEFQSPQRLTDAEWRTRLEAKPPPEPPAWLQPLIGGSSAGK